MILVSYGALEVTLTHTKNISLDYFPGIFSDLCTSIISDSEIFDSAGVLNTYHLSYISRILDESKYTRLRYWEIEKYWKVTYSMNNLSVTDSELIPVKDRITY